MTSLSQGDLVSSRSDRFCPDGLQTLEATVKRPVHWRRRKRYEGCDAKDVEIDRWRLRSLPRVSRIVKSVFCGEVMFGAGRMIKSLVRGSWKQLRRKRTAAIYGACHAVALHKILNNQPAFAERYDLICLPPNFALTDSQFSHICENVLPKLDLFLYQPVSGEGRHFATAPMLNALRRSAKSIRFSYMHCELYHPFSNYPSDSMPGYHGDYIDYAVGKMFFARLPLDEAYSRDLLIPYSDDILRWNLREIRYRENRVFAGDRPIDIKIADLIERRFKKDRLFFTMNHPTSIILNHVARAICSELGLEYTENIEEEPLGSIVVPVPSFTRKAFGMQFADDPLRMSSVEISFDEYVRQQIEYFKTIDPSIFLTAIKELARNRHWFERMAF